MRKAIFYPILCVTLVLTLVIFLIVKNNIEANNSFGVENAQTTSSNSNYTSIKPGDNLNGDTVTSDDTNNSSSTGSETNTEDKDNSSSIKDNINSDITADDMGEKAGETKDDETNGNTTDDGNGEDLSTENEDESGNKDNTTEPSNDTDNDNATDDRTGEVSDDGNNGESDNDNSVVTDDKNDEEDDKTGDDLIVEPLKEYKIVLPNLVNDTLTITRKIYSVNYQITYGDAEYVEQYVKVEIIEDENNIAKITANNPPLIGLKFSMKGSVKLKLTCVSHPEIFKIITVVYK